MILCLKNLWLTFSSRIFQKKKKKEEWFKVWVWRPYRVFEIQLERERKVNNYKQCVIKSIRGKPRGRLTLKCSGKGPVGGGHLSGTLEGVLDEIRGTGACGGLWEGSGETAECWQWPDDGKWLIFCESFIPPQGICLQGRTGNGITNFSWCEFQALGQVGGSYLHGHPVLVPMVDSPLVPAETPAEKPDWSASSQGPLRTTSHVWKRPSLSSPWRHVIVKCHGAHLGPVVRCISCYFWWESCLIFGFSLRVREEKWFKV